MSFKELLEKSRLMDKEQIKISFEQPLYYVDSERNFVKCTLKGVMRIPKTVAGQYGFPEEVKVVSHTTAVCKEGDVFSPERGKKIAVARCEMKTYQKCADKLVKAWRRANDVRVEFLDFPAHPTLNNTINRFVAKAYGCVGHNKRYIAEIGG